MGHIVRFLVLILIVYSAQTSANSLKPGDMVPDFTMRSVSGFGQSLAQARGFPVMLVWVGDCNACDEEIINYQILAESMAIDSLKGWFIWEPNGNNEPPNMRIPVLKYDVQSPLAWRFETRPAVMLISPEGRLDHLITGNLEDIYKEVEFIILRWISNE